MQSIRACLSLEYKHKIGQSMCLHKGYDLARDKHAVSYVIAYADWTIFNKLSDLGILVIIMSFIFMKLVSKTVRQCIIKKEYQSNNKVTLYASGFFILPVCNYKLNLTMKMFDDA